MSGNSSKIEPPRSCQVLSDVTNYLAKRGFSFIGHKPGDGYGKSAKIGNGDLHSAKQRRLGVENVVNEKYRLSGNEKDSSLLKAKQVCGSLHTDSSQNSITSTMPRETKEISNSIQDHCNPASGNVTGQSVLEVAGASKDSCVSTASIPTYSHDSLHTCVEDSGFGKLGSGNTGSVDWLRLPKSQGSKVFSLDKCTGDNAEGHPNLNDGTGECTCSFCLKAAYIWSDLHYQDINGRIATLRKSKKEASILVQKSCRGKVVDKENSDKCSKLESDLSSQWRSLFLHMEDILIAESKQLETRVVALKDLREECKKDLEMINVNTATKH